MIYFLSDAHLGSRAIDNPLAHQQTLIDMLQSMAKDATAIYLLGDIFDFWCEYFWRDRSKEQYLPILNTLKSLTNKGIQVHFFIGNHDIWTFGWLAQQTGVQVHRKPTTITINGKRIFLAHGDGLVPSNYLQQLPKTIQKKGTLLYRQGGRDTIYSKEITKTIENVMKRLNGLISINIHTINLNTKDGGQIK